MRLPPVSPPIIRSPMNADALRHNVNGSQLNKCAACKTVCNTLKGLPRLCLRACDRIAC